MGIILTKKRRILFVAGYLPGYEGVTSYLITLTKELMNMGWEVALASDTSTKNINVPNRNDFRTDWIETLGIKHYYIPFPKFRRLSIPGLAQDFTLSLKALKKLNAALGEYRPDVIHVHSLSVSPFLQALQLFYHLPIVTTCHQQPGTVPFRDTLGAIFNKVFNTFLFGDRCIALSEELKKYFVDTMKVSQQKVNLIYSGVDNEYFRPPSTEERQQARADLNLALDAKVVCVIGSLQARKGHDILLRAMSKLKLEKFDVEALFAGVGGEEDNIKSKISELKLSNNIQLLGFTDTRQVLWASDILVLPSWQEAFPLVIIEAMLCGVVPIRTPASGATEQIEHGINGFIFPFGDYDTLSLQLRQLLENKQLMMEVASFALLSGKSKFSLRKMTSEMVSIYEDLINAHSSEIV